MIKRIAAAVRALFVSKETIQPIPNIQEPAKPEPGVWTTRALDALHQWELSIATLELMGAMGEGEARRQVEYIDQLRKDLLFGRIEKREPSWRPGAEHLQPHPVKENPDGTLYYRHSVYRKIERRVSDTARRQRWNQNGIAP